MQNMFKKSQIPKNIISQEFISQQNLLKDLMDCVPDVIYFKDKSGKLILVNQSYANGLGCSPKDVVGKTDFDFFSKKKAQSMVNDDLRVMRTGRPIIDKVERATRPDGEDNYVSTTKIPRYDAQGKIIGIIGITRDITRRKQLELLLQEKSSIDKKIEALEELNKMKSYFISAVSHEIRTPLTVIKEAVSLISDAKIGVLNEKQELIIKNASINIERLKNIINDLLDISRIERGVYKLQYSLINLNDLLADTSGHFIDSAQEKGIRLEYKLPKKTINIFVDYEKINRVLTNLITNAIKFSEEGSSIKVEVKVFESKVRIGVIDTGVGISKQDFPKLFKRFVQVTGDPHKQSKGLGLGLSIAKELVEMHGGEIWVESKIAQGSKFYFTLPKFYTANLLEKEVRDKINILLAKGDSLYLVNMVIINYKYFKNTIKTEVNRIFIELKSIITDIIHKTLDNFDDGQSVILENKKNGSYDIILSGIQDKEFDKFCLILKDSIRKYFTHKDIKDVFINLGVLHYQQEIEPKVAQHVIANVHLKKILIGSEMRRFGRLSFIADIVINACGNTSKSQTIDLSEGGICFIANKNLSTDSELSLNLEIVKNKPFSVKGRVAWIKKIDEDIDSGANKYKVGLEFIGLSVKNKKIIKDFISSLS